MTEYNFTGYFNDSFGIDAADQVDIAEVLNRIDEIDSSIDDDIENSYH